MKEYFDRVADSFDTMIVTRKHENMVVMSQSQYDSLMETLYLTGNQANYKHLMRSISQYEAGQTTAHALAEDPDDLPDC